MSGEFDDELRIVAAKALGWKKWQDQEKLILGGDGPDYLWTAPNDIAMRGEDKIPPYSTSRDACGELLLDLVKEEKESFSGWLLNICLGSQKGKLGWWELSEQEVFILLRATARQICVAYLLAKGTLKPS